MLETTATGVEIAAGAPPVPEKPKLTLVILLAALNQVDNMAAVEFDPKELIGDIRDKIDDINYVLTHLESEEKRLRDLAAPFTKKAQAISRNYDRLEAYVAWAMEEQRFKELPGHAFKVELQENPPAMQTTRPATAADYLAHPDLVELVREYRWRNAEVKAALLDGRLTFPEGEAFAKITRGKKPAFKPNVESKRGKK